jgi:toxin YhaV
MQKGPTKLALADPPFNRRPGPRDLTVEKRESHLWPPFSTSSREGLRVMAEKRQKKKGKAVAAPEPPIAKNGWTLYAHPAFLRQIERIEAQLAENPGAQGGPAKVLTWITRAIFDEIPQDPTRAEYRLGGALRGITHWFRDKYAGRFRLFFRYDSRAQIIVYGWVNDERSLRTYGAANDAYAVFRRRLTAGNPPNSWKELLREASSPDAVNRLKGKRRES